MTIANPKNTTLRCDSADCNHVILIRIKSIEEGKFVYEIPWGS